MEPEALDTLLNKIKKRHIQWQYQVYSKSIKSYYIQNKATARYQANIIHSHLLSQIPH